MGTTPSSTTYFSIAALAVAFGSCASNPSRQMGLTAVQNAVADLSPDGAQPAEGPWSYEGDTGPSSWGGLSPAFVACAEGRAQSPVNFVGGSPQPLTPVQVSYRPSPVEIEHTGTTIRFTYRPGSSVLLDGQHYELRQFHFHSPSEHTFEGEHYPLEMHLVHENRGGQLAVVGVLFERGTENASLAPLWDHLPAEPGDPIRAADLAVDASDILPSTSAFFRYGGSLTEPPCTEDVKWIVLKTPAQLSEAQLAAFTSIIDHNNRPVQPLYDRAVRARAGTP